ncbi:DNA methyltransferase [Intestinibacter sp.]|uniref:DNA methyltransferase n=1 Tax=Intestinibacter sp. TaxID=1965304 RepID=UPI003AB91068
MTDADKREASRRFIQKWSGKGKEDEDDRSYWLDILQRIMRCDDATDRIEFQKKVIVDGHTKRIDAYIPETKIIIEQKSLGIALDKKIHQSGGIDLTPYEQAKRYNDNLPSSEKARWIVTSNFAEIWVYDMDTREPEKNITKINIKDLQNHYSMLEFLLSKQVKKITEEMELSLKAGELVGKIHDKFLEQYNDPSAKNSQNSLNVLCVRIVFCLYAEDAGLFGAKDAFSKYIEQYHHKDIRLALINLFKVLDTPYKDRPDLYLSEELESFPYCNGGLFANENIIIPKITQEIKDTLIESALFDWSKISPTIFGAVFESTLNPETRRKGGMHYTSIENIHKLIDPLFLDDLKAELEEIRSISVKRTKENKLKQFQDKLAGLKFLDPAAGSGNFLTETYVSLRRLENELIYELHKGQISFNLKESNPIKVSINQFFGIEINDFAVTVAKTALWIAESQMMKETEDVISTHLDFLPLKTHATIIEGNALQLDWNTIINKTQLSYIMGNPPFIGQSMRSKEQANDMQSVFEPFKAGGKLDYVAGWFKKSADYTKGTKIETAFVSSNSICQGESVNLLWELLLSTGVKINFAHTTFVWNSEANDKAHVHCVIVGFSYFDRTTKILFDGNDKKNVLHINGYLSNAPDVFIKNRSKSINKGLAKVVQGSPPADDGRLLLSAQEKEILIKRYPELSKVIKPFIGSREFINDIEYSRYCFWFVNKSPSDYQHIPELMDRFEYIREYRQKSRVDRIRKTADRPFLFTQNRQPETEYLIIPRVSSSSRRYIPIGFLPPDVIASDSVVLVYNASLYDFGIICSNVHNAWMRTVAGRLKSDYRYAPSVYYNFPFPNITNEQKKAIEKTAQGIIDARNLYPTKNLASMYGEKMYLYPELQKAHQLNDKAVMQAYGLSIKDTSEADCVAYLMNMYQELTSK